MRDLSCEISLLEQLFSCLPESLPLNPASSQLNFTLDPDFVNEEGWGPAFNRQMEIAWRSWEKPIRVLERGERLFECIQLLKEALANIGDDNEKDMWVGGWVEKLIQGAYDSGATQKTLKSVSSDWIMLSNAEDTTKNHTPAITTSKPKPNHPLLLNGKLNFPKISREDALAESAERGKTLAARSEAMRAAAAERAEQEEKELRVKERVRKADYRARKREKEIESGVRDKDGNLIKHAEAVPVEDVEDGLTEALNRALRTGQSQKHSQRLGRQKKAPQLTKRRVCWQGPATWIHILAAAKAEGMENIQKHPTILVRRLQKTHCDTGLFDKLYESTVGRWIETDSNNWARWKPTILLRALKESGHGGHGQSKKLAPYPKVLDGAIRQLRSLRRTTTPISTPVARAIVLGHLRIHVPELANTTLSDQWMHRFMKTQIGWSYRTATKAARKRPVDWEALGQLAFLRMVKTIDQYQIKSPRMVVNADQTGISLLPTGKKTWETTGTKQVNSINHDEKRQYTIVVASSCGGDFLPIQSVWGGKKEQSLPSKDAPRRKEADKLGFTFVHGDKRHWSSLETTKEWIKSTLIPHFSRVRKEEKLPPDSPGILYIDAWPIHIAKSNSDCFIPWMMRTHSNIKLLFVPAGCTGEFQPADTLLQRIVKHKIKTASQDFFIAWSTRQLLAGTEAENVILPNDLPTLRDASVAWTLEAFHYMKSRPDVVQKAWALCQTGSWNFTWEKLTCPEAKDLLYTTLASNSEFRNELGISGPVIPRSARGTRQAYEQEEQPDEAQVEFGALEDDVTISVTELVEALTGEPPRDIRMTDDGGWTRFGDEEDIEDATAENGNDVLDKDSESSENDIDDSKGPQPDEQVVKEGDQTNGGYATDNIDELGDLSITDQAQIDKPSIRTSAKDEQQQLLPEIDSQSSVPLHSETLGADPASQTASTDTDKATDTTVSGSSNVASYAIDIAVLGGTHPAIYMDSSLSTKRTRSNPKPKKLQTDRAKDTDLVGEGQSSESGPSKRPRRKSTQGLGRTGDSGDAGLEKRRGRGRPRGRGRARGGLA